VVMEGSVRQTSDMLASPDASELAVAPSQHALDAAVNGIMRSIGSTRRSVATIRDV